jgi:hypothetical protein
MLLRRHRPGPESLDTTADTIDGLPGSNPSVSFAFFSFLSPLGVLYLLTANAILCSTVILASTAAKATATIIHSGRKSPAAIPA